MRGRASRRQRLRARAQQQLRSSQQTATPHPPRSPPSTPSPSHQVAAQAELRLLPGVVAVEDGLGQQGDVHARKALARNEKVVGLQQERRARSSSLIAQLKPVQACMVPGAHSVRSMAARCTHLEGGVGVKPAAQEGVQIGDRAVVVGAAVRLALCSGDDGAGGGA